MCEESVNYCVLNGHTLHVLRVRRSGFLSAFFRAAAVSRSASQTDAMSGMHFPTFHVISHVKFFHLPVVSMLAS